VLLSVSFSVSDAYHKWHFTTHHRYTVFIPTIDHHIDNMMNQLKQSDVQDIPNTTVKMDQILGKVLDYLKTLPNVVRIDIVDPKKIRHIMDPLLTDSDTNATKESETLPLPYVLEIDAKAGKSFPLQMVQNKLHQIYDQITIESQHKKQQAFENFGRSIQWIANIFIGLIVLCVFILMILVTKSAVYSQKDVIDILRLLGARPHYIAKLYQGPIFKVTLLGGCMGALAAFFTMYGLSLFLRSMDVFSGITGYPRGQFHVLILVLAPLIMSILSYIITRFTVLKTLKGMNYA
ncbi:MAG: hypothetical protein Q8K36_01670, partial [Alphaproteobacteria bacterium]|nr:hypothetical protein [Alphaproteobacteria bacterium]